MMFVVERPNIIEKILKAYGDDVRGGTAVHKGHQFDPAASRLLGAALLTMAAMGALYMRAMYYSARRRLPGPAAQLRYFMLLVLALGLFAAALFVAEPGANPEYRPPAQAR